MKLINKDALVAEIERIQKTLNIDDCGGRSVMAWSEGFKNFLDKLEVKEVDLQSEIDRVWDNTSDNFLEDGWKEFEDIAKHFFELGMAVSNKAQKGE